MMPVVGLMTSPQNRTNSARQLLLVSNNSTVHEASKRYKPQSMVFFLPLFPGSAEGFSLADKAINSATKSGRYVYFSNV